MPEHGHADGSSGGRSGAGVRARPGGRGGPGIAEIIATRTGEELELNDRHLNPQMGRILRTLGFDKVWAGGEGADLIDSDGERYLDLFGGYGVFAVGRNNPEVIAALRETLDAQTGNMPQLGVTLLSGVLAEQLLRARAGQRRCDGSGEQRHRGCRGGDQDRPGGDRAPAGALRRARLPRPDARRALDQRQRGVPRRLRAAPRRLHCRSRSATSRRSRPSSRAATSPRSCSSRSRARA